MRLADRLEWRPKAFDLGGVDTGGRVSHIQAVAWGRPALVGFGRSHLEDLPDAWLAELLLESGR